MSILDPGAKLGRFQIASVLGQGAMGVVYLAHDPEIDRPVAIKTVHQAAKPHAMPSAAVSHTVLAVVRPSTVFA
jgi:hypothetical protein